MSEEVGPDGHEWAKTEAGYAFVRVDGPDAPTTRPISCGSAGRYVLRSWPALSGRRSVTG